LGAGGEVDGGDVALVVAAVTGVAAVDGVQVRPAGRGGDGQRAGVLLVVGLQGYAKANDVYYGTWSEYVLV